MRGASGGEALGKCVIETGSGFRANISAQGLKAGSPYWLYLLGDTDGMEASKLLTDMKGKINARVTPETAAFVIKTAVIADKDGAAALVGFVGDTVNYREALMKARRKNAEPPKSEEKPAVPEEGPRVEYAHPVPEGKPPTPEETSPPSAENAGENPGEKPHAACGAERAAETPDMYQMFKAMSRRVREALNEPDSFNGAAPETRDYPPTALDYIFDYGTRMSPFKDGKSPEMFVKIGLRELALLPLDYERTAGDYAVNAVYRQNKHFILARHKNLYLLGAPIAEIKKEESQNRVKALYNLGFTEIRLCRDPDAAYCIMTLPVV
jgi:hypothetical protein